MLDLKVPSEIQNCRFEGFLMSLISRSYKRTNFSRKLDLQILSTTQMLKAKMLSYNRMATNDETCHQH